MVICWIKCSPVFAPPISLMGLSCGEQSLCRVLPSPVHPHEGAPERSCCNFFIFEVKSLILLHCGSISSSLTRRSLVLVPSLFRFSAVVNLHFSDNNRPFPSSHVPLSQSESKFETILMTMTLICLKMKLHAELIFIWKVSHLDSFWNRGTRALGNDPLI